MKNYFEEFDKKYNRPSVGNITVGFSGIDPTPKAGETEKQAAAEAVTEIFQSATLDCGEITL